MDSVDGLCAYLSITLYAVIKLLLLLDIPSLNAGITATDQWCADVISEFILFSGDIE